MTRLLQFAAQTDEKTKFNITGHYGTFRKVAFFRGAAPANAHPPAKNPTHGKRTAPNCPHTAALKKRLIGVALPRFFLFFAAVFEPPP